MAESEARYASTIVIHHHHITFTVFQSQQPSYLSSLIPRYVPARPLRSSSCLSICVPSRKTTIAASKSFSSVASNIWNTLPNHLSSIPTLPAFRKALKHHLFPGASCNKIGRAGLSWENWRSRCRRHRASRRHRHWGGGVWEGLYPTVD